jgi:DNA-binding HxlR family transcriptional regulator
MLAAPARISGHESRGDGMAKHGYGMFCPISKACEILEPRWTILVLAEMFCGSSRFNEIRRGLPGISPTLLSKRLKDMEVRGLVRRETGENSQHVTYTMTPMATELRPVVMSLGQWSLRHVETKVSTGDLDADVLMWNLRRNLDPANFRAGRTVVQFTFPRERQAAQLFWLIARRGASVELCKTDPGFEVDLFIESDLKSLTGIFLGQVAIAEAVARDKIVLAGEPDLVASIDS